VVHIDLFSGIGGFALAVDEVFGKSEHIFCEIDDYCRALLKKRFEGAMIYGDIRTLSRERLTADTNGNGQPRGSEEVNTAETEQQTLGNAEECYGATADTNGRRQTEQELETTGDKQCYRVDILTGGFPCQPFSQAGKRKGTDDNRYLWPEMLRVIRDFKPTFVIAENVRGLLTIEQGMVFEQVCLDLEGEGYSVQAFVIPAVAKNAPHRRDRVWFAAHSKSNRGRGEQRKVCGTNGGQNGEMCIGTKNANSNAPDTVNEGLQRSERPGAFQTGGEGTHGSTPERRGNPSWERNWLEVATELCGVDDGLPAELDGLKLSKSRHRVERLKALGNAIVPQVAMEIMRGIKLTMEVTQLTKEESNMSMENELKRIADALERMAEAKDIEPVYSETVTEAAEPAPKPKAKPAKGKAPEVKATLDILTPAGLMAYCNGELTKIVDKVKRGEVVQKVVAMFKEEFGVASVKEVAPDRVEDAKEAFDAILAK
jgi:DNA (cytosine-5)-methyltransferase 1